MAATTETVTVRMSRSDPSTIWGFRLQGGKEFSTPLVISKVTTGSLSERAGLREGDQVVSIAGRSADPMFHKEAQEAIFACGNNVELVVQRAGTNIWRPLVTPTTNPSFPVKYSLTRTQEQFSPPKSQSQVVGQDYSKRTVQHFTTTTKQSPVPVSVTAMPQPPSVTQQQQRQQEQTSPGYLQSETLRLIREEENARNQPARPLDYSQGTDDRTDAVPAPVGASPSRRSPPQSATFKRLTESVLSENVESRRYVHEEEKPSWAAKPVVASSGVPLCSSCGREIFGVFCKAGDKTLHGDCFTCSTCGTSLKNIGYNLINDKLYCELHAKQQMTNQFRPTAPLDPAAVIGRAAKPQPSPKYHEQTKAPYQPDILKPATSPIQHTHVATLSPQSRGIPLASPGGRFTTSYSSTTSTTTSGGGPPSPYRQFASSTTPTTRQTTGGSNVISSQQSSSGFLTRRGRGILREFQEGVRIPICESCNQEIRGPFVLALNKAWCPDHFICSRSDCRRKLIDLGFVEENGRIYCEICFERYLAPVCSKCHTPIKGDCLTALGQKWHPNCFCCTTCKRPFGNSSFYVEDGLPYCEEDWNAQFTTKCYACQFPIEVGDRWVEAMGNAYHLDCFKCTVCYKSLEGQSFYSKNGRPYCKAHI